MKVGNWAGGVVLAWPKSDDRRPAVDPRIPYNAGCMSGFTEQADIARSTKKGLGRGGGFFCCQTFLVWRLRPNTGLSSGLLLLLMMCYLSGNMEKQRLGVGNVIKHRLGE